MSPRPRQAQGRPGTPIIPKGWETAPRAALAASYTASVRLQAPGTRQVWNPVTKQNTVVANALSAPIPTRAHYLRGSQQVVVEDPEQVEDYLLPLPVMYGPLEVGFLAHVSDTGDPRLDGTVLVVRRMTEGSNLFERDVYCDVVS